MYIERWLKAPMQHPNGDVTIRERGTPQGGVISPVISNLFLHYVFDKWMQLNHPGKPWCRYADDGVVHCKTEQEAKQLLSELDQRFSECGLELHPEKTKIVYCKDGKRSKQYKNTKFDFLGYTFKAQRVKVTSRDSFFIGFNPIVSMNAVKSINATIRRKNWRNMSSLSLQELAKVTNPYIRGWLNYYGKYFRSGMYRVWRHFNNMLLAWVMKKFKSFRRSRTKAGKFLEKVFKAQPSLFAHWGEGMFGSFA